MRAKLWYSVNLRTSSVNKNYRDTRPTFLSFTLFIPRSTGGFSVQLSSGPVAYYDTRRDFRVSLRNQSGIGINVSYLEVRTLKATMDYSSLAKLAYRWAWKFDCASSSFNNQLSSRERVLPPTKSFLVVGHASEDVWAHLPLGEVDIR